MATSINSNNYCIILAGGRGKRLWPSSRMERPKQFIDFFGTGRTQLQSVYDLVCQAVPAANIVVCTCGEYEALVREQLPRLPRQRLLVEPVNRNTAPAVALAGLTIHRECTEARVLIVPSDLYVTSSEAFCHDIIAGLDFVAANDLMLTMGIKPTRPEPGYGYIQRGEPTPYEGISHVQSFTEKPERQFAQMFIDSGEFLWNTGMYLSNISYLRHFFHDIIKDMPYRLGQLLDRQHTFADIMQFVKRHYPAYPNLSMDKAALEMSDDVCVMQCSFGWADLGTWHAVYECMQKEENDNVVIDSEVILENSRGNIVKLPRGHVGVINGLDGYIVAEQGDVLLICKKGDSSALIRKYVNEVGIRYGESFI